MSKGSWRLAVHISEEGRMQPIGTIHAECAEAYFGTNEILDRVARLTDGVTPTELEELNRRIRGQSAAATQRPRANETA